jgi:hypothetical protein
VSAANPRGHSCRRNFFCADGHENACARTPCTPFSHTEVSLVGIFLERSRRVPHDALRFRVIALWCVMLCAEALRRGNYCSPCSKLRRHPTRSTTLPVSLNAKAYKVLTERVGGACAPLAGCSPHRVPTCGDPHIHTCGNQPPLVWPVRSRRVCAARTAG